MARKVYRVLPHEGDWVVQLDGVDLSSHRTKEPAVERARALAELARPSQVVVHRADGTVETESTYGEDPMPPVG